VLKKKFPIRGGGPFVKKRLLGLHYLWEKKRVFCFGPSHSLILEWKEEEKGKGKLQQDEGGSSPLEEWIREIFRLFYGEETKTNDEY